MLIALLLISYSVYYNGVNYAERNCEKIEREILRVGSCDASGMCKVETLNGELLKTNLPIVGEKIYHWTCK